MYSRQPRICRMKPSTAASGASSAAVGLLGRLDGVEGMQHAEVERDRQQRVRHRPVLAHDGVLVAAERGQSVLDEPAQRALGLGGSDGEQARPVDADGVEVHARRDRGAPARRCRPRGVGTAAGTPERLLLLRRGLAVVLVVVPPAADGLATVHQHVEASALVAVEVLHPEAGAVAGPVAESPCAAGRTSAWAAPRRPGPASCSRCDEPLGGERGGLVDQHGSAVPLERVGVGVGADQRRAVAEVPLGVPQRGQHQVQLLPVVAALAQRGGGLDEQDLAVGVLAAVDRGPS